MGSGPIIEPEILQVRSRDANHSTTTIGTQSCLIIPMLIYEQESWKEQQPWRVFIIIIICKVQSFWPVRSPGL
jgi:hypothetical protein